MKKRSIKTLRKELTKLVREIVYLRDDGKCQKCGKKVKKQNAHLSHVIPKSRSLALRWNLNNLKILCFYHHINWWHQNPIESGEWFRKKFPERTEYLDKHRYDRIKLKKWNYEEMILKMKKKLKEMKNEDL